MATKKNPEQDTHSGFAISLLPRNFRRFCPGGDGVSGDGGSSPRWAYQRDVGTILPNSILFAGVRAI
jgi:hypothetical protein